eukprot:7385372-Prymnesium_polylepis.1
MRRKSEEATHKPSEKWQAARSTRRAKRSASSAVRSTAARARCASHAAGDGGVCGRVGVAGRREGGWWPTKVARRGDAMRRRDEGVDNDRGEHAARGDADGQKQGEGGKACARHEAEGEAGGGGRGQDEPADDATA